MGKSKLTEQEMQLLRDVSIHQILGTVNNGRKTCIPCPFHMEKTTGGFWLYPDNTFHCFSCGAHGHNAIDFVLKLGMSFEDGLVELIKYVHG